MAKIRIERLGIDLALPTPEEDARITEAALADPDTWLPSDEEWDALKPTIRIGRPPEPVTKERITIRLSPDVLMAFKAEGRGWQTRIDDALKAWLREQTRK